MMRVWRLSVAFIGPKSRTERPMKIKIGTEVAHVTRDSDITFKIERSRVNLQRAGAYWGDLPHRLFGISRYNLVIYVLCMPIYIFLSFRLFQKYLLMGRGGAGDSGNGKETEMGMDRNKLCAWRHNMPRPSPPPLAPKRLARRRAYAS